MQEHKKIREKMSTTTQEKAQTKRKQLAGIVVSDKMQKTVVVKVERTTRHPLYGKILRRFKKFKAHDEKDECRIGDKVLIQETRPLSREKRWNVAQILERSEVKRLEVEESIEQKEMEQRLKEEKVRKKEEKEKALLEQMKKEEKEEKEEKEKEGSHDTATDEA